MNKTWEVAVQGFILAAIVSLGLSFANEYYRYLDWNPGLAFFLASILYGLLSIRIVGPQELGAIITLGNPTDEVGSGPSFVPFLICRLQKDTRLAMQIELPAEPEKVQKANQDQLEDGKFAPLRITHADSKSAVYDDDDDLDEAAERALFENDPIHRRITLEYQIILRWKIKEGSYVRFLKTIGSREQAEKQLSDEVIGAAQIELAKRTPAQMFRYLDRINQLIKCKAEKLTREKLTVDGKPDINAWGTDIIDASIKLPDLGRAINTSMTDLTAAINNKMAVVQKAQGERKKLRLEGIGKSQADEAIGMVAAQVKEALLKAEAAGDQAKLSLAATPEGMRILELEVLRDFLAKSNYTIASGTGGDLIGALVGYQKILEKAQGTPPAKPPI